MKHKDIIEKMTLAEKASLMSGANSWETKAIERLGLPSLFLSDGPSGLRKQAGAGDQLGFNASLPATCLPSIAAVANSWNPEIGEQAGKVIGQEAKAYNVDVVLGPGLNIKRNPLCGRNFEYVSEDPYLAGKMAAGYVRGIQSQGVSACVKHFAMNNQELRRLQVDSIVDERTMREIYLTNFEIAVTEGKPDLVMSAYNQVNGAYANENPHLLLDILRNEWKFDGVVVTDWGGNNVRIKGIECLNSLEMPSTAGETDREIIKAVQEGQLAESKLDESVDLLIDLIKKHAKKKGKKEETIPNFEGHFETVAKLAEECLVLLKNEKKVLPLPAYAKVAVIGDFASKPRYQGAGSSIVNTAQLTNALAELGKTDVTVVGYQPGFKRYGGNSKGLLKKAVKLAEQAEVLVVFLGLDEYSEVEGIDRETLALPDNQIQLLKALKKTGRPIVTVLSCGCVVDLSGVVGNTDALLYASLSGEAGGKAIAKTLVGEANPSGKLAESFPCKYADVPNSRYFPGPEATAEYREGPFVGYRYYATKNLDVCFPFGFGLSYTDFTYTDLKITDEGATFKLLNSGQRAGMEVSQLYVSLATSAIFRPVLELKGFAKTKLLPGESKEVFIPFDDKTFRYFNPKTDKWEIEAGSYQITIGASCLDARLVDIHQVKGSGAPQPYNGKDLPHYYAANVTKVPDNEFARLLGHPIPPSTFERVKRKRILVTSNTTMRDLKYASGWTGRFFAHSINFAIKFLRLVNARSMSNMLVMGINNQTLKTVSRMTNGILSWEQLNGLIIMFNGHYFKGLKHFFKAGKEKRKWRRAQKAAQKKMEQKATISSDPKKQEKAAKKAARQEEKAYLKTLNKQQRQVYKKDKKAKHLADVKVKIAAIETEKAQKAVKRRGELAEVAGVKGSVSRFFFELGQTKFLQALRRFWTRLKVRFPNLMQFFVFFVFSNGVTLFQIILTPILQNSLMTTYLVDMPLQFIGPMGDSHFYVFDYAAGIPESMGGIKGGAGGLAFFIAFMLPLALAQIINFFLQRNITFKSKTNPWYAAMWYVIAWVIITILANIALGFYRDPLYDLLINTWGWGKEAGGTVGGIIVSFIQSIISFWVFFPIFKVIFPADKKPKENAGK